MIRKILSKLPIFGAIIKTKKTSAPITIRFFLFQYLLGFNRFVYWPTDPTSKINGKRNIDIGIGCAPGNSPGCYIQGFDRVTIGDYTILAPNVGIITGNHDLYNITKHNTAPVTIGKYCWLGMNSVVLPGVELGDHVVVAAGSIVTKSFPKGYVVLAGMPARIVKEIDPSKVDKFEFEHKYHGYIPHKYYDKFKKLYLL